MKNIFRKNQVIITALAIMIAVAGYLNFTNEKVDQNVVENELYSETGAELSESGDDVTYDDIEDNMLLDISEADIEGEDLALEEESLEVADTGEIATTADTKETEKDSAKDTEETPGEAVLVNSSINSGFFSSAKIAREQTRAKNRETLMELVNNVNISEAQKQDAIDGVIESTAIADKENAAEISLGAKGFENSVVSIVDGNAEVIVGISTLTEQQLAQIQDVVKRKTGVAADKIVITPTNVATESK